MFTQCQKARDEKMRKEKKSFEVQGNHVIKMDMHASPNQVENDVFVSQRHELEYTLHKCSTPKLKKEILINNQDFPKSRVCEQHI